MGEYPKLINTNDQSIIVINYNEFSMGRSPSCNHAVEHMGVSRTHCVIKKTGNKWFLYDRCTKGTFVNGIQYKYNDFAELKHGDVIKLAPGTPEYVFRLFPEENLLPLGPESDRPFLLFGHSSAVSEETIGSQESPKHDSGSDKIPNSPSSADGQVPGPSRDPVPITISIETIENELTCSVCSELFLKAVTSSCSHSFCHYCIDEWLRTKLECPVCRQPVTSVAPTIVLDNLVEKYLESQTEEVRATRREMIEQRREFAAIREATNNNDPVPFRPEEETTADFAARIQAGFRALRRGRDPQEAYDNAGEDEYDTDYGEEEDEEEEEEAEEEEDDNEEEEYEYDMAKDEDSDTEFSDYNLQYRDDDEIVDDEEDYEPTYNDEDYEPDDY